MSAVKTGTLVAERFGLRNGLVRGFVAHEALHIADTCREMALRFLRGGRLLAFGQGPYATDAQQVAVEFVHPDTAGGRTLPALNVSTDFTWWLDALAGADDMAMGLGPPEGDVDVKHAIDQARRRGVMTLAMPGWGAAYAMPVVTQDPFIHQELIGLIHHAVHEGVHRIFEPHTADVSAGAHGALSLLLAGTPAERGEDPMSIIVGVIRAAAEASCLCRNRVGTDQAEQIQDAADLMADRLKRGGKLLIFGHGRSASSANDWALDCVHPPVGWKPIPAISLSSGPASLTAMADAFGPSSMFLDQLVSYGSRDDVAIALSTEGQSASTVAALEEARRLGMATIALLAGEVGKGRHHGWIDVPIIVPCDDAARIHEVHASIYHVLREVLERTAA